MHAFAATVASPRSLVRPVLGAALGLALIAGLAAHAPAQAAQSASTARPANVYTETNAAAGNAVAVYTLGADGSLSAAGMVAAGGLGTGAGLGSQGALTLTANDRWLLAVDAGSNQLSLFSVDGATLKLAQTIDSGGVQPISVTVHDDIVYVLNAGGEGNISGFRLADGALTPIAGSTQPLSGGNVGAAQVAFSPSGYTLVVTEKTTNRLDVYSVDDGGVASAPVVHDSAGQTPFGFAFTQRDTAIVSEAGAGAVSSYDVFRDGGISVDTPSLADGGEAACWVATSIDGHYAYTTNAKSGSISGYSVANNGQISLLRSDGVTASTGEGSGPTDMAISRDGQALFALMGGNHGLSAFTVNADGSLGPVATASGLPATAVGLAAN
jgi:6-phosphogluconolactonase